MFRYSLHQELDSLEPEALLKLDLPPPVMEKISEFLDSHRQPILDYQQQVLKSVQTNHLFLEKYSGYQSITEGLDTFDLSLLLTESDTADPVYSTPLLRLASLHPGQACNLIENMILGRMFSAQQMAAHSLRMSLTGGPRFSAVIDTPGTWLLLMDSYSVVTLFRYHNSDGKISLVKLYLRPPH